MERNAAGATQARRVARPSSARPPLPLDLAPAPGRCGSAAGTQPLGPCELLSESLDAGETIRNIARAATECGLADVCLVDVVAPDRSMTRLEVAWRRPEDAAVAAALHELPLETDRPWIGARAAQTGDAVLVAEVTPAFVGRVAQGPRDEALLRQLDVRSCISTPLVARGRLLGTLTLLGTGERPPYGAHDLAPARELARRAALALDYARTCEAARHATRTRDELLGIVAHDLRSPLNGIVLAATLAQQRLSPGAEPVVRRALDGLLREAERMNRLIQDLLDVAHLEAGTLAISKSPNSPLDLATDAVQRQRLIAEEAGIELVCAVPPGVPVVDADPDRILQVFSNLLGNAMRHTPRGGRVTIDASPADDDVQFSVTDTGCGIEPERVPGLFDRFSSSRSRGRTGNGFGLPIVAGIVAAHGGRVSARSEPGAGSTFSFTIPTVKTTHD
jgi:signal transduction histidine kinase